MGLLILGVTIAMVRRGAFAPRVVVELREDRRRGEHSQLAILIDGRPSVAGIRLTDAGGTSRPGAAGEPVALDEVRSIGVDLAVERARRLKVWAHAISPEGTAEALPVLLTVHDGDWAREVDLRTSGGQVVLPLSHERVRLNLELRPG